MKSAIIGSRAAHSVSTSIGTASELTRRIVTEFSGAIARVNLLGCKAGKFRHRFSSFSEVSSIAPEPARWPRFHG
jgi:hypothetical protein